MPGKDVSEGVPPGAMKDQDEAGLDGSRLTDEKCTSVFSRALCFVFTAIVGAAVTALLWFLSEDDDEDYGAWGPILIILIVAVIVCNVILGICWVLDISWMQGRRFVRSNKDKTHGGSLASDLPHGGVPTESKYRGEEGA